MLPLWDPLCFMGPREHRADGVGFILQFTIFRVGGYAQACMCLSMVHACTCVHIHVCVYMLMDVRGQPGASLPPLLF